MNNKRSFYHPYHLGHSKGFRNSVSATGDKDQIFISPYLTALAQAITKYQKLGNLNNKHLFLRVLWAEKSKIKVLANSLPGGILFLAWTAAFSLCPHMVERVKEIWSPTFYKNINLSMDVPPT